MAAVPVQFRQQAPEVAKEPHTGQPIQAGSGLQGADTVMRDAPGEVQRPDLDSFLLFLVKYRIERSKPRPAVSSAANAAGVICVSRNEKVPNALRTLVAEGILSAPVVNKYNKYVGMLDMMDVVSFVVELYAQSPQQSPLRAQAVRVESWSQALLLAQESKFQSATVKDIIRRRSQANKPEIDAVRDGYSLFHAFELLARSGSVRRVAVVDERNEVVGLVTQSMLISLIYQNLNRLGSLRQLRVRHMSEQLRREVLSVKKTTAALEAFGLMESRNLSGLAVVDDNGALVDTLSVRDVRGIGATGERFHRLWYECAFFKELVRSEFKQQTPSEPLSVSEDDTLEKVILLMNDGNLHRVFELDARKRPVHVISQRDVLLFLLREMGMPT